MTKWKRKTKIKVPYISNLSFLPFSESRCAVHLSLFFLCDLLEFLFSFSLFLFPDLVFKDTVLLLFPLLKNLLLEIFRCVNVPHVRWIKKQQQVDLSISKKWISKYFLWKTLTCFAVSFFSCFLSISICCWLISFCFSLTFFLMKSRFFSFQAS